MVSGQDRGRAARSDPDYTALDQLMPHPVHALQWISILNPPDATFDTVVKPRLDGAHERIAQARRKVAAGRARS